MSVEFGGGLNLWMVMQLGLAGSSARLEQLIWAIILLNVLSLTDEHGSSQVQLSSPEKSRSARAWASTVEALPVGDLSSRDLAMTDRIAFRHGGIGMVCAEGRLPWAKDAAGGTGARQQPLDARER